MDNWKTLGLHYTHHPEYVSEIHHAFAEELNKYFDFGLKPELTRNGIWVFGKPCLVSCTETIKIVSTLRQEHSNDLYFSFSKPNHRYWSSCNDLRDLPVPEIRQIFRNPTYAFNHTNS